MAVVLLCVNVFPQAAARAGSPACWQEQCKAPCTYEWAHTVAPVARMQVMSLAWATRLVTSPQGASYVSLSLLVLLCTSVSFAQPFPCSHPSVFLHLSLAFQPSIALIPNARMCLVLGLVLPFYKDESFPQCVVYPRVRTGKRNLDLSISNGGGWV